MPSHRRFTRLVRAGVPLDASVMLAPFHPRADRSIGFVVLPQPFGHGHQVGILIGAADDLQAQRHVLIREERQRHRRDAEQGRRHIDGGIAGPIETDGRGACRSEGDKGIVSGADLRVCSRISLAAAKRLAIIVERQCLRRRKPTPHPIAQSLTLRVAAERPTHLPVENAKRHRNGSGNDPLEGFEMLIIASVAQRNAELGQALAGAHEGGVRTVARLWPTGGLQHRQATRRPRRRSRDRPAQSGMPRIAADALRRWRWPPSRRLRGWRPECRGSFD